MGFYDREIETETLRRIEATSHEYAQMTVITGRRRIGKTTLIKHAYEESEMIYFFVGRKSEALLCQELSEAIRDALGEDLGDFSSMARLFAAVMQIAKRRHFTLVLDEFQNFKYVNESSTFSGWILGRYFRQMYRETGLYNIVTNYWEKEGRNEIDLIAVNEADREIVIGEVKRDLHGI